MKKLILIVLILSGCSTQVDGEWYLFIDKDPTCGTYEQVDCSKGHCQNIEIGYCVEHSAWEYRTSKVEKEKGEE